MRRAIWPRFAVEAAFLIVVAVATGMLELDRIKIVLVMAAAWLLVAALEWSLSRRAQARRAAERATVPAVPAEPEPGQPGSPPPDVESVVAVPEPAAAAPEALSEPTPGQPEDAVRTAGAPELEPAALAIEWGPVVEEEAFAPEPVEIAEVEEAAEPEPPTPAEPGFEPSELDYVPAEEAEAEPAPPAREAPREWNVWDLERAARAGAGEDVARDEERSFLLMYLRDFAGPDGVLPSDFDGLVRDSFGDVLAARR